MHDKHLKYNPLRSVLATSSLHDWVPHPLPTYLAWRRERMQEDAETSVQRGFRLFAVHNKYTVEDWQWLLSEAGFTIRYQTQLRPTHQMFVTTPGGR